MIFSISTRKLIPRMAPILVFISGLSAQITAPTLRVPDLVPTNRALANQHIQEGKLWKAIAFLVDEQTGEIQMAAAVPIAPRPHNELQSTLVLEYITVSGRSIRVPATTPWHSNSGAEVPTDEDGVAIRIFNAEGRLIGECKDGPVPGSKDMYAYDLARIDEDLLGFHNHGRHVVMEARDKVYKKGFGNGPICSARWSWDEGKSWSDPKSVRGDDAITWLITPEIQEKLKQNSDPLIEVLHSAGLKLIRKTYHFQDLPSVKNGAPLVPNP